jgi:hypothetical protein
VTAQPVGSATTNVEKWLTCAARWVASTMLVWSRVYALVPAGAV